MIAFSSIIIQVQVPVPDGSCSMVFVVIGAQNDTCSVQSYIAAVRSSFDVACGVDGVAGVDGVK